MRPRAKFEVGTGAALGAGIGAIGTLLGGFVAGFMGLGMWMPLGILGIMLAISGPSMLIAWLKLRQRNLGPILDANGWAINGRVMINMPLGAALTEQARLPKNSTRTLDDPYEGKANPWRIWILLGLLVVIAIGYIRFDHNRQGRYFWQDAPPPAAPAAETGG